MRGEQREEESLHPGQAQILPQVLLAQLPEVAGLRGLLPVGADHPHPGEVLVRVAGQHAEVGLDGLGPAMHQTAQGDHDHRESQEGEKREQGQPGADAQHRGCNQQGPDASIHQVHERRPRDHAHREQIVGGAGHHISGGVSVVEFGRHPLKMTVEPVPQVRFDTAAAAVEQLAHAVAAHAAGECDGEQQANRDLDLAERFVLTEGVDALFQEPRPQGGEEVGDDDQQEPEGVRPEVGPQVGQQGPQFAHKV